MQKYKKMFIYKNRPWRNINYTWHHQTKWDEYTQFDLDFCFEQRNYSCHIPDIYFANQLWWQNISNLKKIFIINVFQMPETEQNEITLKT